MDLPPFAPFPGTDPRREIVPKEWELCIDAWILLAQRHLLLSRDAFALKVSQDPSVVEFLLTYVEANARHISTGDPTQKSNSLRRTCYLLVHRCLVNLEKKPPPLLAWQFLSDFSICYAKTPGVTTLLQGIWHGEDLGTKFQKHRAFMIRDLETPSGTSGLPELEITLERTAALLRCCQDYGHFLMLGYDFVDALSDLYRSSDSSLKQKLVVISYRCFSALMDPSKPNFSMLLDHLYGMYSSKKSDSLLSAVCSNTPFVRELRDQLTGPDAVRGEKLVKELLAFEGTGTLQMRQRKTGMSRLNKGKGKQRDEYGHGALDESVHVHKMSLITQVQDLFPDLGSGFVVKLLDEYGDDMEQVTAHLLDNSLPPQLKSADRSETMSQPESQPSTDLVPNLPPHPAPPSLPNRRNIHDNDAFDRLTVPSAQIHRGRRSSPQTADTVPQDRGSAPNKAAILSALAAFDSDDDERDDTYDVEDVGGTVDTAMPGSDEIDADLRDKNEEALFRAYKMSPEAFERDAATRRGNARMALRSETGMTDEAIEGEGSKKAEEVGGEV
ncbi:MAG: hypothetical protein L6R40_002823 [Gallowayella cf. fulva]|nr:MAG: hypothetical protein L6R40_002823 [Xanthomendoza cf. fulva]